MNPESLEKDVEALREKVGRLQKRARSGAQSGLTVDALAEVSHALKELRVSSEELSRRQQGLNHAQLERERERRKYIDLFRSAPAGYLVTDAEGRVTEVNEAAAKTFNVAVRTLVGTLLESRVVSADLPRLQGMLLTKEPAELRTELRLRRRGEPPFLATVTRTVIADQDDAPGGYRWSIYDLTSVREQEHRLRESEALLRSLVDGAKDFAILRLDVRGCVASWNKGAERIFGYAPKELLGKPFERLRDPQEPSTSEKDRLARAERVGRNETEGWCLHKNGTRIWTNCVDTPLNDASGRVTGFVRVLRDVTEQRRTQMDLAEQSRLSSLLADIGGALTVTGDLPVLLARCAETVRIHLGALRVRIWTHQADAGILELRASAGEDSPRSPTRVPLDGDVEVARVARRGRADGASPKRARRNRANSKRPRRKTRPHYVGQPILLDSSLLGVLEVFSGGPFDDPGLMALEAVARSLALGMERLRTEERLALVLASLEQTMETMPDVVFRLDTEGGLVAWNGKLESVTGLSGGQLQGRSIVDLVPEEEAAQVRDRLAAAWVTGRAEWEGHIRHAEGTNAPISWVLASQRDLQHRIIGLTGSGRDITERRESEMRLAQLSRRLLHLREKEQRRISRELHDSTAQNLAAVCMSLTALCQGRTKLDAGSLRVVRETAELADRCLNEVRTMSYLLHPPLLDEVGLPAALRWYTKGFAKRSGVRTQLELPDQLGRLEPELELTVFRIVQESLSNVHRHANARSAVVSLALRNGSILLEVADNGRGIPALTSRRAPSTAPEIGPKTRRRTRPPASRSAELDWMGLGLMGIRERVQEVRGRFDVSSGAKGTTIQVELPVRERAAP